MIEPRYSLDEPNLDAIDAVEMLLANDSPNEEIIEFIRQLKAPEQLYQPDYRLKEKLKEFSEWYETGTKKPNISNKQLGERMEEISYLVFSCLKDVNSFKSFNSPDSQLDLVISIDRKSFVVQKLLALQGDRIIVEAKNTQGRLGVKEFSRLCSILHYKYEAQSNLGIIFAPKGATGFPKQGQPRQKKLSDARLIQALYHAKTQKYILVFDYQDIIRLGEPGSLFKIIEAKQHDVADVSGIDLYDENLDERDDLPPHLSRL